MYIGTNYGKQAQLLLTRSIPSQQNRRRNDA